MKSFAVSLIAATTAATVLAAPVGAIAAQSKLMPQSSESVAPKAKGPKPYQASQIATCGGPACEVKFGKKANKVRRVTDISCLFASSAGMGLGALIRIDEQQISYLPLNSRGPFGAGEFASGALAIDFAILGGQTLTVEFISSDAASGGNCVINGTID